MNKPNPTSPLSDDINESYGEIIAPMALRLERLLPGPIETVWAYLTQSDKLAQWLAPGTMYLCPNGKVDLKFNIRELTPYGEITPDEFKSTECGNLEGHIIEAVPMKTLHYTWGSSEVKFELNPEGEHVRLTLTHSKLSSRNQMVLVSTGWHTHTGLLLAKLEGSVVPHFWPRFLSLKSQYETMIKE